MTWYTLAPAEFSGVGRFWNRDSGLFCRGLQMLGHDSKAIVMGPRHEDEDPRILRATMEDLTNPDWWISLQIDGVIMFSWVRPTYQPIIDAVMASGVRIVHLSDTHGVVSPHADPAAYLRLHWEHRWHEPAWKRLACCLAAIPYGYLIQRSKDKARARLIASGHACGTATPEAMRRFSRLAATFEGPAAAKRIHLLPLPVTKDCFLPEGTEKRDEVVSIGRWDTLQKRTPLLCATISIAATLRPQTRFHIFGRVTDELSTWHDSLPAGVRERVIIHGFVPNEFIASTLRSSRVMLVTSAYEGCHIASAEAVCSGASIVGCDSPFLGALRWHASMDSGRLSKDHRPGALARCLADELDAWDRNERDPRQISSHWCEIFHPDKVAALAISIASGS